MPPRGVRKGSKWARMYEHVKESERREGRPEEQGGGDRGPDREQGAGQGGRVRRGLEHLAAGHLLVSVAADCAPATAPGGRTYEQLYEEAKDLGIKGRSKMNKRQLVGAVEGRRR